MDEEQLKIVAAQLRKPSGELALFFGNKMNEGNKELYENTLSVLDINDSETILEVGMGNGFYVKSIVEKAKKLSFHGCDYSKEMVDESNKFNAKLMESASIKFHLANANHLPFSENNFDLIISINTIYFWKDPEEIFNEFKRILKPSGRLVLSLRPEKSIKIYPFVKYGFELYSKIKIESLLKKNNFKINSIIEKEESKQMIDDIEVKVESLIIIAEII